MQVSRVLDVALGSPAKVKLIRALLFDSKPKSGRALAREVGMSHAQVLLVLADLTENGLVRMDRVGRTHAYSIRAQAFPITELLRPLFERERALPDLAARRIAAAVKTSTIAVSSFGSVVRQEDHSGSDLDIVFVVATSAHRRALDDELAGPVAQLAADLGLRLGPYVLTARELERRFRAQDRFVRELTRTARCISGKTLLEVITSGSKEAQDSKRRPRKSVDLLRKR